MNKFFSIDNFKKNWYWYIICLVVTYCSFVGILTAFDLFNVEFYNITINDVYPPFVLGHSGFYLWMFGIVGYLFYRLGRFIFCKYLFEDKKTDNETNSQLNNVSK